MNIPKGYFFNSFSLSERERIASVTKNLGISSRLIVFMDMAFVEIDLEKQEDFFAIMDLAKVERN